MEGMLELIKAPRLWRRPRGDDDRLAALQGESELIRLIYGLLKGLSHEIDFKHFDKSYITWPN